MSAKKRHRKNTRKIAEQSNLSDIHKGLIEDIISVTKAKFDSDGRLIFSNLHSLPQSNRRHLVRSAAALIEAVCYQLRLMTLEHYDGRIPATLKLALLEQQIEVNDKGDVITKTLKVKTLDNIKFTFKSFDKLFKTSLSSKFAVKEFGEMRHLFSIRDVLMHPRKKEDLIVDDDNIQRIVLAHKWFEESLAIPVLDKMLEFSEERGKKLEAQIKELESRGAFLKNAIKVREQSS